jgi:hypothetical protein
MTDQSANFFLCDDLLVALNGKFTALGIYTGDIVIPTDPFATPQLVAVFDVRTPIQKPFRSAILQVSLPGEDVPRQLNISSTIPAGNIPGRTMIRLRTPFLMQGAVLTSGIIEASVLHDGEVLPAGKQWVVTLAEAQANNALLQGPS